MATESRLTAANDDLGDEKRFLSETSVTFALGEPTRSSPPIGTVSSNSLSAQAALRANISETVLVLLINEQGEKEKGEMNGNSLGVVLSPGGLAGAERSEGERSEPQRSAAAAKAGADAGWPRGLIPKWLQKQSGASSPRNINFAFCRKPRTSLANAVVSELCCAGKACTHRYWRPGRRERADGILEALTPRKARTQVQAQSTGRRKSEAATPECAFDRRSA